jgi:hypothetical protein
MIVGYGVRAGGGPMRFLGGLSIHTLNRANWQGRGAEMNFHAGEGTRVGGVSVSNTNGQPSGYVHPGAYTMPIKPGGMTSRGLIVGEGDVSFANLAGGLNGEADASGAGDISNASLGLIVSLLADILGSGTITADILGRIEAAADMVGAGDLTGAATALANLSADLDGAGTIDGTGSASGDMSADITASGDVLTSSSIADAVWAKIAEGTLSYAEMQRIFLSVLAGKSSVSGASVNFRDLADTKNRVAATVSGSNRTAMTLDGA